MYAIAGVSGHVGAAAADRLLAVGAPVRVIVRDAAKGEPWSARGAEVAVADLADEAALTRALRGASGAFLLLPPIPTAPDVLGENERRARGFASAVRAVGVDHVVLLSSVAAQVASGTGPIRSVGRAEAWLAPSAPHGTWVRGAYFVENWASALAGLADGVFPTFVDPDVAFDQVATADLGRVVADALLAGGDGQRVVEVASGAAPITARQVAAELSSLVGRELAVVHVPTHTMAASLQQWGVGADLARLYQEMTTSLNEGALPWSHAGWFVRGPTTVRSVLATLLGRAV